METTTLAAASAPAYDDTGKLKLDHIYNQPDPRDYFSTLSKLDYRIPDLAKPFFQRLIEARRETTGEARAKIVDVGCSYGINAALLKHDLSMEELYGLYQNDMPGDRMTMKERDRALFSGPVDEDLSVVGLDPARNAIDYAVDVGILDAAISTNLERDAPSPADRRTIDNTDLIISTGCVGYVTEASLEPLVEAGRDRDAWMANFVLRMFDYEPVEEMMAARGYVTERLEGSLFQQRRFVSGSEQSQVIERLHSRGLEPEEGEKQGWYLAELHVSRPASAASTPLAVVFSS